jgi:glyoxylase I family protein
MPGVHHTAIVTADVETAKRFWCDGLGLRELFDHTFTGDWPTLFGAHTDTLQRFLTGIGRRFYGSGAMLSIVYYT